MGCSNKSNKKVFLITGLVFVMALFLISLSNSQLSYERENRLNFGHVLYIDELSTDPFSIPPGSTALLNMRVSNIAADSLKDIRIKIDLPSQVVAFNDVTVKKIERLDSGESSEVQFNIMALPNAVEGVYSARLYFDYVTVVGDNQEENVSISLLVGGTPKVFAEVQSSEIYKESKIGDIVLKFVNNDIANIKFLTVELKPSTDYEVLSSDKYYVGDLDSDDFETVDFRLKVKSNKNSVDLPLSITYKDSLNRAYSSDLIVALPIRTASEMGASQGSVLWIFIGIGILIIVGYILYKRRKRKNAKRLH